MLRDRSDRRDLERRGRTPIPAVDVPHAGRRSKRAA